MSYIKGPHVAVAAEVNTALRLHLLRATSKVSMIDLTVQPNIPAVWELVAAIKAEEEKRKQEENDANDD